MLETLIATAILITVVLAAIGLSNSLIRGTVVNADRTITNRWSSEGLELVTKIRDDQLIANANCGSQPAVWFCPAQADGGTSYGWYLLENDGTAKWKLTRANTADPRIITYSEFTAAAGTALVSGALQAHRLICVEAVGATSLSPNDDFHCNTNNAGQAYNDGSRTNFTLTACQADDFFCELTRRSLTANRLSSSAQVIPPGNAVKVRSVVVWQDKDEVRSSDIATMLTNWKAI